jgi:hypothetical protein
MCTISRRSNAQEWYVRKNPRETRRLRCDGSLTDRFVLPIWLGAIILEPRKRARIQLVRPHNNGRPAPALRGFLRCLVHSACPAEIHVSSRCLPRIRVSNVQRPRIETHTSSRQLGLPPCRDRLAAPIPHPSNHPCSVVPVQEPDWLLLREIRLFVREIRYVGCADGAPQSMRSTAALASAP